MKHFKFLVTFLLFIACIASTAGFAQYTVLPDSPIAVSCITLDPTTGIIYAQDDGNAGEGTAYYAYDPNTDTWTPKAVCPIDSGNNGGAVYWNGRIYTIYTGNAAQLGVYDISSDSWSTVANGLGLGTGNIATDGNYIYAVSGTTFKRYDPAADTWTGLANPTVYFQNWGGLAHYNGWLYGHTGNGTTDFAKYEIATNTWTTLTDVPGGAVLGSDIDPVGQVYYCTGSYSQNNMYMFNLITGTWATETLPWASTDDGGMAYSCLPGIQGMYVSQGQAGTAFARRATPAGCGCIVANPGGPYTVYEFQSVTLDGSASIGADSYAWDLDNDGTYGDVTGESPTVDWATLNSFGISAVGSYPIGLEIDDGTGCLATGSTVLTVEACTVCCIVAAAGNVTMLEGQNVTLNGSASTGAVNYLWDLNNDGTYGDVTGAAPLVSWATLNAYGINSTGTYIIGLEINDGTPGCSKTDLATLTVNPNPTPSTITITSPNGGESWATGSLHDITWTWIGAVGDVKIEYSTDNGGSWADIIVSTANDGSHPWTLPGNVSNQCLVRVSDTGGGPSDTSNAVFTISGIVVTSPNGGEIWTKGKTRDITWDAVGVTGQLKISLWKNGVKIGNITAINDLNARSYAWPVGQYIGGTAAPGIGYTIKIKENGVWVADESDAPFRIMKFKGLTSPDGGERWLIGATRDITWNASDSYAGSFGLVLFKDGAKIGNIARITDPAARSYSWSVGQYIGGTAAPGTGYKIKAKELDSKNLNSDMSDAPFEIRNFKGVLSPNGGENLLIGTSWDITWNVPPSFNEAVVIVLLKDGAKVGDIALITDPTARSYTWTIGEHIGGVAAPGTGYRIKVKLIGEAGSDVSNTAFDLSL